MSKISDLDIQQIFREMVNPEDMSLRVDPQLSGEVNIELNAEDGDSVQVRPVCEAVLTIQPDQAIDVSKARSIFISSTQPMEKLLASLDGQTWHEIQSAASFYDKAASFKLVKVIAPETAVIKLLIKG